MSEEATVSEKAVSEKDIEEAVAVIQKSIEKKIAENTDKLIRSEIFNTLCQQFLESLCHKIEQIGLVEVVSRDFNNNFINFSCKIPKINPSDTQIAHSVIKIVDEVSLDFFFKKQTHLHLFNFCSKYFMFSQFSNEQQNNLINFNWSRNKFEQNKICYCFTCKFHLDLVEEQKKKEHDN